MMSQSENGSSAQAPSQKTSPLQFKEATHARVQSPDKIEDEKSKHVSDNEMEEEDASEAVLGCNHMVHRTLSRTSLKSQHGKLTQTKSSRSIQGSASNAPRPAISVKSARSTDKTPGGLETTKENGSDSHASAHSDDNEKRGLRDSDGDGETSPTDSEDGKIIHVDWEGPDDPENPKK